MKKITRATVHLMSLVVLLSALFSASAAPALAQTAVVSVSPAASSVAVGQEVQVNVNVTDVTNLFGAEFHITFPANLLEVVDANVSTAGVQVSLGTFLSPDFVAQNVADNTAGTIDVGISQMAPHGAVSGSGTLATITFKGKANGTANVNFTSVLLADAGGMQITASAANGTVNVTGGTATTTVTVTATTTTPTTTTTPPPSSCTIQGYHVVRAGESLYSIGRAYATLPNQIAACNGIVNPSRIYAGMKLAIPVAPWSPIPPGPVAVQQFTPGGTVPPPGPTPTPAPSGCRYYYTVRPGDTLTAIACRYGTTIYAIGRANNIYNLVTKRAVAYQDATMEWVDGNLGSRLTMKYPAVYMMEPGARGEILSIAFASSGQHQDAGAKLVHCAPHTSGQIISKSISKNGGRSSYRGLVKVEPGAKHARCSVVCDALILDEKSRSDTYPYIEVAEQDSSVGHEASVSRIGEEQLFYLMSRGLTESEASTMIVNGFIEPLVKELPMEYAVEMNRLIELQMEGSVG